MWGHLGFPERGNLTKGGWGGGGDLENTNPAPVKIKQYLNKNLTDPYQSFNLNKSLLINQYLPTLISYLLNASPTRDQYLPIFN